MSSDDESPKCSYCGTELQLAKPEHQIDIGTGGKTYYDCPCHKLKKVESK